MSKPKKEADVRFSKFGTVSFTALTKVNDFIDHLEDGKVMASQCNQCNATFFPPRADCCECLALADALSCNDPHQECVDKCFELCEPTRACYCSSAIEVGCAAECGCSR